MLRSAFVGSVVVVTAMIGCAGHVVSSEESELAEPGGTGGALPHASGGAPPASNAGAPAGGGGPIAPGPQETPATGPFQGVGTGGAPVSGAGGSSPVGAGGQSNDGGMSSGGSDPAMPSKRKLRDTAPGDVVVFDPDEVYVVGYVSDGDNYIGPYGIAPLADTTDTVSAIPLFSDEFIRRTDGHLLYTYQGADSTGRAMQEALYEFRRDEVDLAHPTYGETYAADIVAGCAAAPRGPSGQPNTTLGYSVGFDGSVYYGCYEDMWPSQPRLVWYAAPETPVPFFPQSLASIGPNGRTLVYSDSGSYSVLDLQNGTVFATHPVQELFVGVPSTGYALAIRSHAAGFWLAGGSPDYMTVEAMQWVNLDLSGAIAGAGHYAPLPPGVTLGSNNWSTTHPVLDGRGALYQFAWDGSDGVVVRRPMTGESDVYYRLSSYDISHPHQVMPYYLVTAQ